MKTTATTVSDYLQRGSSDSIAVCKAVSGVPPRFFPDTKKIPTVPHMEQSGFFGCVRLMGLLHCEVADLEADMSNLQKCISLPRCLQESAPKAVYTARV